jgi:CDP-glucose 4,6-dehydratase
MNPNPTFWRGKRVFLTGHTGFKGGWLALWLQQLGAVVHGYSLQPPTEPNLFTLACVGESLAHQIADIRDLPTLKTAITNFKPDIILHLAAQPLLRLSYDEPVDTYATNVMGTVHVMEAARHTPSAKVTLIITTDKCYENNEQNKAFAETDPMGGYDPYSSSKGCAELAVAAYARSYFNKGDQIVASVRAGNVIGGGDWAQDRLMTDIIAAVSRQHKPVIRNPAAIRPWQHVLEPLSGYLCAVEYLWEQAQSRLRGTDTVDGPQSNRAPYSWNFGPNAASEVCVADVANQICKLWGFEAGLQLTPDVRHLHEAHFLRLDSTKAHQTLGWKPRLTLPQALAMTVDWYRDQLDGKDMKAQTLAQITAYQKL